MANFDFCGILAGLTGAEERGGGGSERKLWKQLDLMFALKFTEYPKIYWLSMLLESNFLRMAAFALKILFLSYLNILFFMNNLYNADIFISCFYLNKYTFNIILHFILVPITDFSFIEVELFLSKFLISNFELNNISFLVPVFLKFILDDFFSWLSF